VGRLITKRTLTVKVYQLDTAIELKNTFTEADGVTPIDPGTVTLRILTPDGVLTSYVGMPPLTMVSPGVYTYNFITAQSGLHSYKWQGEDGVDVTTPDIQFTVAASLLIAG
jgi:hypothetical protein